MTRAIMAKYFLPELSLYVLEFFKAQLHGRRYINKLGDCRWTVVLNDPSVPNCDISYPCKWSTGPLGTITEFSAFAYALESLSGTTGNFSTELRKAFFDLTLAFKNIDDVDQFLRTSARASCINNFCAPVTPSVSSGEHGMPDWAMVDAFNRIHCAQKSLKNFVFKMMSGSSTFLGLLRFQDDMVYIYIDRQSFDPQALRPAPSEGFELTENGVAKDAEFKKYMNLMDENDSKSGVVRHEIGSVDYLIWRREWSPDDKTPDLSWEARAIRDEVNRIIHTPTSAVEVWIRDMMTYPANTYMGGSEYYLRIRNACVHDAKNKYELMFGTKETRGNELELYPIPGAYIY
ncbi:hypothetical protein M433DRAFT_27636 [Acidomyces richmondensis BFW]|nr:hypothetical protein M433DRAFT_27636 [Acidomyces richmondensis BFW]